MSWQSIETAPKTGEQIILAWRARGKWWQAMAVYDPVAYNGSHWPQPPAKVSYAPTDRPLYWRRMEWPPFKA